MDSNDVTVLCLTSPIPIHPQTRIIDETLRAVRHHLPYAPILILADGVRPELEDRRQAYLQYLDALDPWLRCSAGITIFREHVHQTLMLHTALSLVQTPFVLFQEHDLPLRTDADIDWDKIMQCILAGEVDLVRFMLTESIHPEHEHLMCGRINPFRVPLVKTRQFSGWTHLASTEFYRKLLHGVTPSVNCFLEPYAQGRIETGAWDDWRISIYVPDETAARRLYHLHGRGFHDGTDRADDQFLSSMTYR